MKQTILMLNVLLWCWWIEPALAQESGTPGRVNANINQIVGATPSATNPLPSRLTDGTAFIVPVLDTTLTARFPAGSTPTDNESNAVTITRSGAFMFVFDGTTWDRWMGAVTGTVTANAGSGTFTVGDGAGALNVIVDSSALPSGAATAANQDGIVRDGTGDTTQANVSSGRVHVDGSGVTQPVSATSLPLPTGAATLAEQQAQTTALQLIDNLPLAQGSTTSGQSGTLVQGAVTTGAPTYTTGQTSPLSLDLSGNLRVTGGGGGTQYIEDDAAATNPTGTAPALVRDDTPNGQVTADGDIVAQRGTNYGAAYVQVVTSAGAFVDAFGGSGGTAQADRSAFTDGTTNMTPIGGVFNETNTDPTEDQTAAVRITADRALHTNLRNATGTEIGTAGAPVRTDPTGTTTQPVSGTVTANAGSGTFTVGDGAGALNVIVDSGALTANAGTGNFNVVGTKSNNGGAPGSTNLGVLPAVANAAAPTHTETNQVALRAQLDGDLVTVMEDELPAGTQNIGDVDVLSFPDNEPINVAQINGVAVTMNNGVAGTGVQRVTIASDSTGQVAIASLPNEGQQTAANSISVTPDTDNDPTGTTGSAVPGEATLVGGTDGTNLVVPYIDPCQREARTQFVVDIVTATTTEIANQVASEFFYICSINIGPVGGAVNVAIVEDDTDACASPTAGLNGGVTSAEGWNITANGGIVEGNGQAWVMKTTTANRFLCIITSAAVQVSGTITYVSAP